MSPGNTPHLERATDSPSPPGSGVSGEGAAARSRLQPKKQGEWHPRDLERKRHIPFFQLSIGRRVLVARLVTWRVVADWQCMGCGACCEVFRIPLRPDEAVSIARAFGDWAVELRHGRPYLARVGGRCAFLSTSGRCLLQPLGLKPRACKVWPFSVSREPKHGSPKLARFEHLGREWYVYTDSRCPGLILGEPSERLVEEVLPEIVEIWVGARREQEASTSALPPSATLESEPTASGPAALITPITGPRVRRTSPRRPRLRASP